MSYITQPEVESLLTSLRVDRGTLLTYLGHLQTLNASKLKNTIRNLGVFRNDYAMNASPLPFQGIDAWTRAIGERLKYSSTELRKNLEKVTELGDRMYDLCRHPPPRGLTSSSQGKKDYGCICRWETVFCRTCSCGGYFHGGVCGRRLIDYQAMRQSLFVDKVHELGWLGPGFLEDPESTQVLNHCILRYYG